MRRGEVCLIKSKGRRGQGDQGELEYFMLLGAWWREGEEKEGGRAGGVALGRVLA